MIPINFHPDRKVLRNFGFITAAVAALVGLAVFFRVPVLGLALAHAGASRVVGACIWGLGLLCILAALTAPAALKPLYLALNIVAWPIGLAVSYVLLFVLYYLVLTPVGLAMRLIGRDPLHRRFDRQASTYWVPYEKQPPPKRYFRQF